MDYKYIEQLLDKYWDCETSLEEEQILRCFFRQKEVPAHLSRFQSLFAYQDAARMPKLGEDFDERVLAEIERPVVKAKRLTWRMRMMPLFGCNGFSLYDRWGSEAFDERRAGRYRLRVRPV